jgi:lipoprotein signal peptidase
MSVLKEVLEELWSMFVGDRRLTLALLAVVVLAAATVFLLHGARAGGPLLLAGAIGALVDSVFHAAARRG